MAKPPIPPPNLRTGKGIPPMRNPPPPPPYCILKHQKPKKQKGLIKGIAIGLFIAILFNTLIIIILLCK